MTSRDFALQTVARLQKAGHLAFFAGGSVRDQLLGIPPIDYDIATSAKPDEVVKLFTRCIQVGAAFGVVEVLGPRDTDGEWLRTQVATFRTDGHYTDGRRPDEVVYSSPEEDAARRDFTINGLFFDPIEDRIYDYVAGIADLNAKILRAIGDPVARFHEDKLRILRALRMAARFRLEIEPKTYAAILAMKSTIHVVSPERITEELRKMLAHPERVAGFALLRESGLLAELLPAVSHDAERVQRLLSHLPRMSSANLAFAATFSSVTATELNAMFKRLRLSNDDVGLIRWLVMHQESLLHANAANKSAYYPLLVHPAIDELLAFNEAIAHQRGTGSPGVPHCRELLETTPRERLDPPPLLTGEDLIASGRKPGPMFKRILSELRQKQLDDEIQSTEAAQVWIEKEYPNP